MRLPARKLLVLLPAWASPASSSPHAAPTNAAPPAALFNDSHFHLTNYVQEGRRRSSCG